MNIAEIAKRAGVSSAAVSRYFNNGYISEEKKERIRRVVEENKTGRRDRAEDSIRVHRKSGGRNSFYIKCEWISDASCCYAE